MFDRLLFFFRSRFGKDRQFYRILNRMLGVRPENVDLYKLALIHRSASVLLEDGTPMNNERLEFLGDAVIETIVSEMLYIEFPFESEGFLTQLRSKIVNRSSLNELALKIGLDGCVVCQPGLGQARNHLYGDAFEALIGALYLDQGYNRTNRLLINGLLKRYVDLKDVIRTETDFKSRLIEWCQQHKKELHIESGNSERYTTQHPHFLSTVAVDGRTVSRGTGPTKKGAEQAAAKSALKELRIDLHLS